MTVSLLLNTDDKTDLLCVADEWGLPVNDVVQIWVRRQLHQLRQENQFFLPSGHKGHKYNTFYAPLWECDEELIIKRAGQHRHMSASAYAVHVMHNGVAFLDPDSPMIKRWVTAIKACRLGFLPRAMYCERQGIPNIRANRSGHLNGQPLPERLDRLEPLGRLFRIVPTVTKDCVAVRQAAAQWGLDLAPVVRCAVHLGLQAIVSQTQKRGSGRLVAL